MTYADTVNGERAHIWDDEASHPDRAMCGVLAPYPYSASEADIREAERKLCETCKRVMDRRRREGRY